MTLNELKDVIDATVLTKNIDMSLDIDRAFCADLMSDVLAFSIHGAILVTGLTNAQVVRTAEVADIKAIVFIQGKRPDIETIALAEDKKIPLFVTDFSMFGVCGRLFEKGLQGRSNRDK